LSYVPVKRGPGNRTSTRYRALPACGTGQPISELIGSSPQVDPLVRMDRGLIPTQADPTTGQAAWRKVAR